jgi:hypothetical protein
MLGWEGGSDTPKLEPLFPVKLLTNVRGQVLQVVQKRNRLSDSTVVQFSVPRVSSHQSLRRQRESIENVLHRDDKKLPPIKFVRHGRSGQASASV